MSELNDAELSAVIRREVYHEPCIVRDETIRHAREVQKRRAVEAKLRELHVVDELNQWCVGCDYSYPCQTIRLLDGES